MWLHEGPTGRLHIPSHTYIEGGTEEHCLSPLARPFGFCPRGTAERLSKEEKVAIPQETNGNGDAQRPKGISINWAGLGLSGFAETLSTGLLWPSHKYPFQEKKPEWPSDEEHLQIILESQRHRWILKPNGNVSVFSTFKPTLLKACKIFCPGGHEWLRHASYKSQAVSQSLQKPTLSARWFLSQTDPESKGVMQGGQAFDRFITLVSALSSLPIQKVIWFGKLWPCVGQMFQLEGKEMIKRNINLKKKAVPDP